MAVLSVQVPYPVFLDRDGQPLDNGDIYIGTANTDAITNQIPVYYDQALTITAAQPLKTSGGYIYRNGTPAQVYVNATDFSISVCDNKGLLIYNFPTATGIGTGAASIQYDPPFTGGVPTTVEEKLSEYVSVLDFGAVGDGVTNDTVAIQAALNSGSKNIVFTSGKTYLVNGGLTYTQANGLISASGATIKLKNNAPNKYIIKCTGDYTVVDGGTWDANRANGNSGTTFPDEYGYWAVLIECDYGTIRNTIAKSSYGAGLMGNGNHITFQNNTVSDCFYWGIFITSPPATHFYGNKAIGNTVDCSASTTYSQGILFTSTGDATGQQRDWVLANNIVTGAQGAGVAAQCICLAVRGERGVVSGNVTRYGSMGFSEGGDDTVVTGNVFTELQGAFQYGIEPSGWQTITGNFVTASKRGVNAGNTNTIYDKMVISGNTFITTDIAIQIIPDGTGTANDVLINGNYLYGVTKCVSLARTCDRPTITGNKMVGDGTGAGVFLNNPSLAPYAFASGNSFRNIVNPLSAFNPTGPLKFYTDLYSVSNNFQGCTTEKWTPDGVSAMGTRVSSVGCILSNGTAKEDTIDELAKQIQKWGTGTPEGVVAAGVGSIFYRTDGGAGTTLYVKQAGTGNTGWVGK